MKTVYKVTLKLLSPLHINGGVASDGMRITVRQNGKPYVPATLFKGIVRGNFQMLMNTFQPDNDKTRYFFGDGGFCRSRVIFDNLETSQELVMQQRTNVSISRYQRKAVDGALVCTEVVPRFDVTGEPVVFDGYITAYFPTEDDMMYDKFLAESIAMINNIGTGKSRGLGFVEVNAVEES